MGFGRKTIDLCMLVLKSLSVSEMLWKYLESLDQDVLASKRPDEIKGINHCVHEKRITKEDHINERVSLDQLLKRNRWCQERGIIAISAPEDGYAKDYFAERLMTLAYDQLKAQSGKIRNFWRLEQKVTEWYLPILVMPEVLEDYHNGAGVASVCIDSIQLWLKKHLDILWNKKLQGGFRQFMKYMLQKGQVLLLLPRGCLEDMPKNIQELIVREFCRGKTEHGNIAIYVVNRDKEFCLSQYKYPVELGKLSNDEIMEHIRFVVKGNSDWVEFFEKQLGMDDGLLKKELQIPERLLLLSKLLGENSSEDERLSMDSLEAMKSTVQFYEFIIHKNIEMCVKEVCGRNVHERAFRVIYDTLRAIAWRGVDEKREQGLLNRVNDDFRNILKSYDIDKPEDSFHIWSELVAHKDFFVDANYNFSFVGCKHYLIAENLYNLFRENVKEAKAALRNQAFLEKQNRQIYLFLIDKIKDKVKVKDKAKDKERRKRYFDIVWNSITDDKISGENNRVQMLADILERYDSIGDITYSTKLVEFILKELSNQYYDSNIFDALHSISKQYEKLDINHYLKVQYAKLRNAKNSTAVDNQKRRLVYYFGKEKCGIPEAVIEDLIDTEVHIHVKYHIMLAVIENYSVVEELLDNYWEKIRECVKSWKEDCILYSDYKALLEKRNNLERSTGSDEEDELQNQLFQELGKGEYWRRAHAAGALGRQRLLKSVDKLQERLADEIGRISEEENSLKAVSYMVEAICEIFYWQNKDISEKRMDNDRYNRYQRKLEDSINAFMELITFDDTNDVKNGQDVRMRYFVAFATISEGIIYLVESDKNEKPEEFGRHIKDDSKDLDGKYDAITKALEIISNRFPDEADNAEQKRRMIDDFYREFSIIHTSRGGGNIESEHKKEKEIIQTSLIVHNDDLIENQINIEAECVQVNFTDQGTVKKMKPGKETNSGRT